MRRVWIVWLFALVLTYPSTGWSVSSTTLALNFTPVMTVSTSINCPVAYPSGQNAFTVPVAPGTKIMTCSVGPSGWTGAITLSGPDASFFAMATNGTDVVVGANAIATARTYTVTVTANP